ncbi:MAG: ABC transporter ATP-binding protein [Phototrophicaceae bacterium]
MKAFQNWRRLMGYLFHYRRWLIFALIGLVGGNVLAVAIPQVIGLVVDVGVASGDVRFMIQASIGMVMLGIVRGASGFMARYFSEKLSHHVVYDMRNNVYEKVMNLSFSYHDRAHVGTIVTRAISDVQEIQRYFANGLVDTLNITFLFIGTLAVMLSASPLLTFVAVLPLIPLAFTSRTFAMAVDPIWQTIMEGTQVLSNHIQENAIGSHVVRAFAREEHEIDRFRQNNEHLYHRFIRLIDRWSMFLPLTAFIAAISSILLLIAAGWLMGQPNSTLTVGEVVALNAYILQLAQPLRFLGFSILLTTQAIASSERVFEILDAPITVENKPDALIPSQIEGRIRFEDVGFAYDGEKSVLKHISFEAQPGQVIGIVGATGAGKTSLINLITRFYDVTTGKITLDGHDLRDLELGNLRRQIGMVMQSSLLFSETIHDNIAYGRAEATRDQVVAAATAANAHPFISEFEKGYDTMVGERGVTLSGGQRQRVAIARALLINPRILILDDSTSSVDTQTEFLIQDALRVLMNGRTTFIIAQRLTSVTHADLILVLDQGEVVERGTHDELIKHGGMYYDIYRLQMEDQDRLRKEASFAGELELTQADLKREQTDYETLVQILNGVN